MSILNVERVVALYLDSVFLLITIEERLENITCRDDRNNKDIPPSNNPIYGEMIKDIPIKPPITISDLFSFK